jgi:hypothetical protein
MDGDGDVDGAGMLMWQRYLGYQGQPLPSGEPGNKPVPEPASLLMGAAAILMGCGVLRGGAPRTVFTARLARRGWPRLPSAATEVTNVTGGCSLTSRCSVQPLAAAPHR